MFNKDEMLNKLSSTELKNRLVNLKLIITDIDGILTDGKIHYSNDGSISKQFCIYDGILIKPIIEKYDLEFFAVTGRNDEINIHRLLPLGYSEVIVSRQKLVDIELIAKKFNISMKEILYVGDDVNDVDVLREVGISLTCRTAPHYLKKEVNIVTNSDGGDGVLREIIELIVDAHGDDILAIF